MSNQPHCTPIRRKSSVTKNLRKGLVRLLGESAKAVAPKRTVYWGHSEGAHMLREDRAR